MADPVPRSCSLLTIAVYPRMQSEAHGATSALMENEKCIKQKILQGEEGGNADIWQTKHCLRLGQDSHKRTNNPQQAEREAHVDVKTTDGYLLCLFCVGFTKKRNNQIRKTSYAQHQQVCQIRKKWMEIMTREVQTNDLKEVVNKLIPDSIGKDIEKACQSIYPLHDVYVRKVKMLKKPKFELGKLMELHSEGGGAGKPAGDQTGAKVEWADGYEPPVQESV
ncbi:40S ribosomal protein S3a-like [Spea bombifrons]|uniref:40S ribosomal protein S3a-like n=1 Tax=Spea bombifrons TaxID=233779 RepID=UPI00234BE37F|nr:40S ribosomal protein S3a-like [Spea bombifrons]